MTTAEHDGGATGTDAATATTEHRRVPAAQVALLLLAVAGLGIAGYLTAVHYASVPLVCTTGGVVSCSAVTTSSYSVVPGTQVPVTVPGLVWFLASGAMAAAAVVAALRRRPEPRLLPAAQVLWCLAGMGAVLYLVYAEVVQLHRICEWCTAVHAIVFVSLLLSLARLQPSPEADGRP